MKAFGKFDYSRESPAVATNTIYDLASVSKVVGTTTAAALLYQQGKLRLEAPRVRYLPEFSGVAGHDRITVRQLLTHTSGLPAYERLFRKARDKQGRCCVIRARGEPGREAHPPQYTRSDRGIPSSAIRFSTAHLIAASTFWFLTVRAERLTPSIALYRETAFSATLWRVQPLDFRHS